MRLGQPFRRKIRKRIRLGACIDLLGWISGLGGWRCASRLSEQRKRQRKNDDERDGDVFHNLFDLRDQRRNCLVYRGLHGMIARAFDLCGRW